MLKRDSLAEDNMCKKGEVIIEALGSCKKEGKRKRNKLLVCLFVLQRDMKRGSFSVGK